MAADTHPLLASLRGGDRRSIGRANAVVRAVLRDESLVPVLVQGLTHSEGLVRMRAADALEKVSAARPDWVRPHRRGLLTLARSATEQEVRWHLVQILPRLSLTTRESTALARIADDYLDDASAIVRVSALQALCDLGDATPAVRVLARRRVRQALTSPSAAVRARARHLVARLT